MNVSFLHTILIFPRRRIASAIQRRPRLFALLVTAFLHTGAPAIGDLPPSCAAVVAGTKGTEGALIGEVRRMGQRIGQRAMAFAHLMCFSRSPSPLKV